MQDMLSEPLSENSDLVDLGVNLGRSQSFALLAGRCSAAQAQAIRLIRHEKKYQKLEQSWDTFCSRYLKMSRTQADKLIGLLEEFGPAYFDVAQIVRISPETYRSLAPSIKDGALCLNGDMIELNAENAERVAAAVNQMRLAAPVAAKKESKQIPMSKRILQFNRRCAWMIAELQEIASEQRLNPDKLSREWMDFAAAVKKTRSEIQRIGLENGIA